MLTPLNPNVPNQGLHASAGSANTVEDKLREAAKELETTFLAEMLSSAGLGETSESFGGGAGEDQFSSFLRMEQARAMVDAGGIGLAEAFFNALKERTDVSK
ncbi:chemotactic signal-response protein CheL [Shimia sp. SK013]|uniref:rod-binding protein n=1 Tax=Shimia sp. SK013 TaxID=1389006 RepID=UPI0006CCB156|nr:rod-binding protein [Shimia sp. SK013]KPA20320.1 chemotactic signal-response protein CheL [Shimia sp. SK013]